jgi:hypothetical protein
MSHDMIDSKVRVSNLLIASVASAATVGVWSVILSGVMN